jgi:hypothetical protein
MYGIFVKSNGQIEVTKLSVIDKYGIELDRLF